jgi:hypothetical protein
MFWFPLTDQGDYPQMNADERTQHPPGMAFETLVPVARMIIGSSAFICVHLRLSAENAFML